MNEYKPVTVAVAGDIAKAFDKDVVVIFAIDHVHAKSHFTTFGKTANDKIVAAEYGDLIANEIAGAQIDKKETFEDFRLELAKHKENADALLAECKALLAAYEDGANCCCCEVSGFPSPYPCLTCRARAAIAKVEGTV